MSTILTDNRDKALQVGYAATDWSVPVEYDTYLAVMRDWGVQAVERDGECIGAVYKKDGEVHVSILKDWRKKWVTKGMLRQIFSPDVKFTVVTPGHEHMFEILTRLGMKKSDAYKFEVSHGY